MWNESAWQAARELWQPGDRVGDQNHSGDWGSTVISSSARLTALNSGSSARNRLSENRGDGRSSATLKPCGRDM